MLLLHVGIVNKVNKIVKKHDIQSIKNKKNNTVSQLNKWKPKTRVFDGFENKKTINIENK
jgi:hypothetical protein